MTQNPARESDFMNNVILMTFIRLLQVNVTLKICFIITNKKWYTHDCMIQKKTLLK